MSKRLEHIEAAKDEAEKYGATFNTEHRKRHIMGIIALNGQQRKVFLSVSPSCSRVIMNVREDVRKKIKEMVV